MGNIPDGRLNVKKSRTVLRVEPVTGESTTCFCIKLSTSHYAFSLKRSVTVRTLSSFYTLANILKDQHPYVQVRSLPLRPWMYFQKKESQAHQLTEWLANIFLESQLLSNRALHLFLQTNLTIKRVSENADGTRDDQVVPPKSPHGFLDLFGGSI